MKKQKKWEKQKTYVQTNSSSNENRKTSVLIKSKKSYLGPLLICRGLSEVKSISMVVRNSRFVKYSQTLQFMLSASLHVTLNVCLYSLIWKPEIWKSIIQTDKLIFDIVILNKPFPNTYFIFPKQSVLLSKLCFFSDRNFSKW